MSNEKQNFCGRTNRREFLCNVSGGFAKLALTGLLSKDYFFNEALAASGASLILWHPSGALSGQSEKRNLPFHVRGPKPYRHL